MLDHKGAVTGFKMELYRRQLDVLSGLSVKLNRVHENSEILITLIAEKSLPASAEDPTSKELFGSDNKANQELYGVVRDAELLVPAEVALELPKYATCAARLWAKAFVPEASTTTNEAAAIWEEQQRLFNLLRNHVRTFCGTDALSADTIRPFSSAVREQKIILRTYRP